MVNTTGLLDCMSTSFSILSSISSMSTNFAVRTPKEYAYSDLNQDAYLYELHVSSPSC